MAREKSINEIVADMENFDFFPPKLRAWLRESNISVEGVELLQEHYDDGLSTEDIIAKLEMFQEQVIRKFPMMQGRKK